MPANSPVAEPSHEFEIQVDQLADYEFRVRFDGEAFPPLDLDEPAPLGRGQGPNASRILAAAIGNCLSASLLFCARRARVPLGPIHTRVRTRLGRNEHGRLRIQAVEVEIDPGLAADQRPSAARCLDLFEDYCVVTASVRQGIPVQVRVTG